MDKTLCRTPTEGKAPTQIPTWKFEAMATALRDAVAAAGDEGLSFADLPDAVASRLSKDDLTHMGSIMWHVTAVKLELEVRGEIARLPGKGPQRLVTA